MKEVEIYQYEITIRIIPLKLQKIKLELDYEASLKYELSKYWKL